MTNSEHSQLPLISVVLPILNEGQFIKQTLDYITGQDYPADKLEILVVDGFSEDDTRQIVSDIASRDSRVRLLDNPKRLSSAGRNIGAIAARGNIILYIDGHVFIDNNQLLRNVATVMEEKQVSVISRPQFLDTPDNSLFQRAVALGRRSIIGHGLDSTIYTERERHVDPTSSGAGYRKEIFTQVGYFDESFDAAEDVEFNYRVAQAGFQSYTSPKLAVYYYPRSSLEALFKQMKRYGTGRFRFMKKHPEALSPGSLAPTMLLLTLTVLLALSTWISFKPLIVVAGFYLLSLVAVSAVNSITNGARFFLILPAVFATIHFGLAWGFITEAVRNIGRKK